MMHKKSYFLFLIIFLLCSSLSFASYNYWRQDDNTSQVWIQGDWNTTSKRIYWSNTSSTYVQDISQVMIFGDDFNAGSLNTTKWGWYNGSGFTYSVNSGLFTINTLSRTTAAVGYLYSNISQVNFGTTFLARANITTTGNGVNSGIGLNTYTIGSSTISTNNTNILVDWSSSNTQIGLQTKVGVSYYAGTSSPFDFNSSRWTYFKFNKIATDNIRLYVNNVEKSYQTTAARIPTQDTKLFLANIRQATYTGTITNNYDWVLVKKYSASEPTITCNQTGKYCDVVMPSGSISDYQVILPISTSGNLNISDTPFPEPEPVIFDYWRQDDNTSQVWIKGNWSTTSKRIYWSNTSSTYAQNGNEVFIFFDDFDGTSINTSKWTETDTGSILYANAGYLNLISSTSYDANLIGSTAYTYGTELVTRSKWNSSYTANGLYNIWYYTSDNTFESFRNDGSTLFKMQYLKSGTSPGIQSTGVTYDNNYHIWKISKISSSSTKYYVDGVNKHNVTSSTYIQTSGKIGLRKAVASNAVTAQWDYIYLKNYSATEPTITCNQTGKYCDVVMPSGSISDYQVILPISTSGDLNISDTPFPESEPEPVTFDYWRQDDNTSQVWIKGNWSTTPTRIFWSNVTDTYAANGTKIFTFFDNFTGTTFNNTGLWTRLTTNQPATQSGGYMTLVDTSTATWCAKTKNNAFTHMQNQLHFRWKTTDITKIVSMYMQNPAVTVYGASLGITNSKINWYDTSYKPIQSATNNVWYTMALKNVNNVTNTFDIWVDNTLKNQSSPFYDSGQGVTQFYFCTGGTNSGYTISFDWVFVTKDNPVEPAIRCNTTGKYCDVVMPSGSVTDYQVKLNVPTPGLLNVYSFETTTADTVPTPPTDVNITPSTNLYPGISVSITQSGATDAENDTLTYYYKVTTLEDSVTKQDWSSYNTYKIKSSDADKHIVVHVKAFDGTSLSTEYNESYYVNIYKLNMHSYFLFNNSIADYYNETQCYMPDSVLSPNGLLDGGLDSTLQPDTKRYMYCNAQTGIKSYSFWFKPNALITTATYGYYMMLDKTDNLPAIYLGSVTGYLTNEMVTFYTGALGTSYYWTSSYVTSFKANEWYHFVFSWDTANSRYRLYINNVDRGLATLKNSPTEGTTWSNMTVFDIRDPSSSGIMDMFGFSKVSLNATNVDMLYQDGLGRIPMLGYPFVKNVTFSPTTVYSNTSPIQIFADAQDFPGTVDFMCKYYKNGTLQNTTYTKNDSITNIRNNVFNLSYLTKGYAYKITCNASDDGNYQTTWVNSSQLTILSTPPVMVEASITPVSPLSNETLIGFCNATDFDLEILTYNYTWYVNDIHVGPHLINLNNTYFDEEDIVKLQCSATDGSATRYLNSTGVEILTTPPVMNNVRLSPLTAYTNTSLLGYVNASNFDGSNVSYECQWYKNNVPSGSIIKNNYTLVQEFANNTYISGPWSSPANAYDGDWSTYARLSLLDGYGYLYVNYTKASGFYVGATERVYTYGPTFTVAVPSSCFDYSEKIQIYIMMQNVVSSFYGKTWFYCYNGTWNNFFYQGQTSDSSFLREDQLIWNIYYTYYQNKEINFANLSHTNFEHFDNITLSCRAYDGIEYSDWLNSSILSISNIAPVLSNSQITPASPLSNQTLTGICNATDYDLDTLTYNYTWFVNGIQTGLHLNTLLPANFEHFDNVTLECSVFDGTSYDYLNSSVTEIQNTPAVISSVVFVPVNPTSEDEIFLYCNATDYDNDILTKTYSWFIDGVDTGGSPSQDQFAAEPNGLYTFSNFTAQCEVNDTTDMTFKNTTETMIENTAPWFMGVGEYEIIGNYSNENLTANCVAYDWDNHSLVIGYEWFINGITTGITTQTLNIADFTHFDNVTLECSANDSYDTTYQNVSKVILNAELNLVTVNFTGIYSEETLVANCLTDDVDGDVITFEYIWYVNHISAGLPTTQTLAKNYSDIGDNVTLSCRGYDGFNYSDWMNNTVEDYLYCEQETANQSTACGGLSTGSYSQVPILGPGFGNFSRLFDTNYSSGDNPTLTVKDCTPATNQTQSAAVFYVDYRIPLYALTDNITWTVKHQQAAAPGYVTKNYTLPSICTQGTSVSLKYQTNYDKNCKLTCADPPCAIYNYMFTAACYNGSGWHVLNYTYYSLTALQTTKQFYEEKLLFVKPSDLIILNHGIAAFGNYSDNADNTTQIGDVVDLEMDAVLYDEVDTCSYYLQFNNLTPTITGTTSIFMNYSFNISTQYTSEYDNITWYAYCNDTSGNDGYSTVQWFVIGDYTPPVINVNTSMSSILENGTVVDNVINNPVNLSILFEDNNLFQISVNVTCDEDGEVYYFENLTINDTQYLFSEMIDLSGLKPQRCNITMMSSDDHTAAKIPKYDVDIEDNTLKYKTENGLNVLITSSDLTNSINTKKLYDRYNFEFDYKDSKLIRKYIIESDGLLFYRHNSTYPGHFVAWNPVLKRGNWIDFALENSNELTYIINKINDNRYEIIITHNILLNPELKETFEKTDKSVIVKTATELFTFEKPLLKETFENATVKYVDKSRELTSKEFDSLINIKVKDSKELSLLEQEYGIKDVKFNSIGGTNIQEVMTYFYIGGVFNITSNNKYNDTGFTGYTVSINKTNVPTSNNTHYFNLTAQNYIENVIAGTYTIAITHPQYITQTYSETMETQYTQCLQEQANISTACGGLNTGDYTFSNIADFTNPENMFDNDTLTYAEVTSLGDTYLYVNYTIPTNASFAVWNVTAFGVSTDAAPIIDTFNKTVLKLRIAATDNYGNQYISLEEFNGTAWEELTYIPLQIYNSSIFEEKMTWYFQDLNRININYNTSQSLITLIYRNVLTSDTVDNYTLKIYDSQAATTVYHNITDGSAGITLPFNANVTYNITFIKSGHSNQSESYMFDYKEVATYTVYVHYYASINILDEATSLPFDFTVPTSAYLFVKCNGSTQSYLIPNATNVTDFQVEVDCAFENFKFILSYADGVSYYRTNILTYEESLNATFYLIDLSVTPFVYGSFIIDDLFGDYENPSIYIKKQIGNQTVNIQSDFTDIENKIGFYLIENHEYIIEVHSDNNPVQIIGTYSADVGGDKTLAMYDINLAQEYVGFTNAVHSMMEIVNITGIKNVVFTYSDDDNTTSNIQYIVHVDSLNGTIIYQSPVYTNVNSIGAFMVPLTGYENRTIVGQMIINHETEGEVEMTKLLNKVWTLPIRVQDLASQEFLNWFFIIFLSITAVVTASESNFVALGITGLAFLFVLFGWFTLSMSVLGLAILFAIIDTLITKGNKK